MMRGYVSYWRWLAAGGAALFAVAGIVCALCWSALFAAVLSRQTALSPSQHWYKDWESPPVPLYFNIYLFNWTNADRFPDEKPTVEQLGPYRFMEQRQHVDVRFHEHNSSVSYRTKRVWYWDETNDARLDDVVTTLDVITVSAIYKIRNEYSFIQNGLAMALAGLGHKLYVTKTAGELLFEGYEDSLLTLALGMPDSITGGAPKLDRFGYFYSMNGSTDLEGHVTVSDGMKAGELPGQILKWNYLDHLPFYEGECSKLAGSVGEFLPRDLTEESKLTMFIGDLCRTVNMDYIQSGTLKGLKFHKYALTARSFDNSSLSSANSCFCNGACAWGGVMNVSACRYGSPTFLSLPHFLHGDSKLLDLVHGLEPDPEKHSFYFAIEPKLGVALDVAGRFQVNMYLEPNPNVALVHNIPRMLFPCMWVEQHVTLDNLTINNLRKARAILDWGAVVCACSALIFAAIIASTTCCMKKSDYIPPQDFIITEKPKDECEIKLNPM